jgi:hypothetical protein
MAPGIIATGPRAFSYMLGAIVVAVAVAASFSSTSLPEIVDWAERIFGITFLTVTSGLVFVAVYSWTRIIEQPNRVSRCWSMAS